MKALVRMVGRASLAYPGPADGLPRRDLRPTRAQKLILEKLRVKAAFAQVSGAHSLLSFPALGVCREMQLGAR